MAKWIRGARLMVASLLTAALLLPVSPILASGPPTEPMLRIDPAQHTAVIRRIAVDDSGRWLVTASDDKTARVWDARDGRLLTTLRVPISGGNVGKLYAVAISPNGQTVALGGWTRFDEAGPTPSADGFSVFLFDRASGRLLRRIGGLPDVVNHLAFAPDGRSLAMALGGRNGLRLFAVADGSLIAEDRAYGDPSFSVHFGAGEAPVGAAGIFNGRLVTTSYDGMLRLYRFDGARLTLQAKRAAPGGKEPYTARFSPDGKRIAVGFRDTPAVNVLDSGDLSLNFAPDTIGVKGNLGRVAWSRDGATLFAAGQAQKPFNNDWQTYIRRWTGGGMAAQDWPVAESTLLDLAALPDGRLVFSSGEPSWGVVAANGARQLFHANVVADFRDNQAGLMLSADGKQAGYAYQAFGKHPAVFDSQSLALLAPDAPQLFPPSLTAPGLVVTDWKDSGAPKFNGALLTLNPGEKSRSLAMLPAGEGFVLGAEWYLRAFDRSGKERWRQAAPGVVWAVNVSRDGRWVVAAHGDGTLRWHRATDGVEQLAFFPHADRKRWVMWTPSGYYEASLGADELIGWHLNRGKDEAADFFPASRFRSQFNRADVLARILETGDETEALRLADHDAERKTRTTTVAQVLPPVVEIVSPNPEAGISTASITIKYRTRTPGDAPVTALRARINGLPLDLGESAARALAAMPDGQGTRVLTLPIPPRNSEIQLFAENKNGVSVPAVLAINWTGAKSTAPAETRFKPKLYVLSVGVSKYQNPDYDLGLAAKDATDLAAVFLKQKGQLYSDVQVRLLTDGKATRDDVVDGLEWLKREVTARDVGVMFLAGHGMNDNTGKYFFMPYNADPTKLLRTGVAQGDIKETLNALAGKAVFFVDTCHSGNSLGTAKTRSIRSSTDAFANELAAAENGVVVFTASTGRQLSQEDPAWGNGAFTKAVVEGLSGKADFQKSGKITHKGLDYYVSERVKQLTNGTQSPVSITPNGITDFPIALVN